jgi:hypothetical protein
MWHPPLMTGLALVFVGQGTTVVQWIVDAAAELLSMTQASAIVLRLSDIVYDYEGSASTILRCHTSGHTDSMVRTVIVKHSKTSDESLLVEAAGLEFLNETAPGVAPRFYGIDAERRVMVLEDLSPSPDNLLGNILFGNDADYAERALLEFQRTLARMHLATGQHKARFQRTLAHHGSPTHHSRHRVHTITAALQSMPAILQTIEVALGEDARQNIDEAVTIIDAPGMFSAFVHGDATPANAFYVNGDIRLFDLETAGYRHSLLDGSYARLRYIHSVWARYIPLEVQRQLMAAYRDTLLAGCAVDESLFDRHLAACCAGWLAGLCALLPEVIVQDRRWGRSTNRQRIVAGLNHFVTLAEELDTFHALQTVCHAALQRLSNTWPAEDCAMRLYPAFTSSR